MKNLVSAGGKGKNDQKYSKEYFLYLSQYSEKKRKKKKRPLVVAITNVRLKQQKTSNKYPYSGNKLVGRYQFEYRKKDKNKKNKKKKKTRKK